VSRHVVIGTAGHVDHGKTALVRALTGVDTDRWEEEKRRGITIDLGFAPLELADDLHASIVDVPGHEDFIRNMVAGATGVDVALLVIAADEGVMPQTEEHLAILEFLGVRRGVVALTKSDLVDPEWLELVRADVRERVAGGTIEWEDVVTVSATTGEGLEPLRAALARGAADAPQRAGDDLFRLPVDRVFTVPGVGTVVTGTAWSGTLSVGDEVVILPQEIRSRVRGVEVHGETRERAVPGRRTALALAGIDRSAIGRGSTVVAGGAWRATQAIDVRVRLLPDAPPLGQRTRLHVHHGTAVVLARVTPARDVVPPGGEGVVRLRLEEPLVTRWGDRLVLRAYSPVTTIGGAVVLDPWPDARPRRPVAAHRWAGDPVERVVQLVQWSGGRGVRVGDLSLRMGISPSEVARVLEALPGHGVARAGDRLIGAEELARVRGALLAAIEGHHQRHPHEPGIPTTALRRAAHAAGEVVQYVESALVAEGVIAFDGPTARLAAHRPRLGPKETELAERLRAVLAECAAEGATAAELAERTRIDGALLGSLLDYLVREATAVRVGSERYYGATSLGKLRDQALQELLRSGKMSVAQLREKTGLTRKYLIPFLEWMDNEGYTVRVGDVRVVGPRGAERH